MNLTLECEREQDGRRLVEVAALPGVVTYGASVNEAIVTAETLALRVLAEHLERGEEAPVAVTLSVSPRA